MTSAFFWVILPLVFSLLLFVLNRYAKAAMITGLLLSIGFALSALLVEVDYTYVLRGVPIKVQSEMIFLGRSLVLENADRGVIFLLFLLASFWLLIGTLFDSVPSYSAYVLAMIALLIAGIAVEPFLFAALFIEMAVLVSLPMLIRLPDRWGRGEVYYLIFMTLSVPFLLLAGWAADGVEANPLDTMMFSRTLIMLAIGFSLLLGSFPFIVWIPKLTSQIRPARVFLLLSILPIGLFLLFNEFLVSYAWLRNAEIIPQALNFAGLLLIVMSGVWAAFQEDLGRLFGFAVLLENGFTFLALSIGVGENLTGLALIFFTRLLAFAVWGTAAAILAQHGVSLTFNSLKGLMQRMPVVAIGILLAYFSVSGLPLLAGFSSRILLIQSLAVSHGLLEGVWIMVSQIGFLVGGLRLFSAMLKKESLQDERMPAAWYELLILGTGMLVLLIVGIIPSPLFQSLTGFLGKLQFLPM